jgi:hypothetical protein
MKKIIILVCLFFLLNSCNNENGPFDPTYFNEGFKGITFTSDDGSVIKIDPEDWCYTNSDNNKIFKSDSTIGSIPVRTQGYAFYAAYPNPCPITGSISLKFALPMESQVLVYILNKDREIATILVNERMAAGMYSIKVDAGRLIYPGVYRAVIETGDFKCYGDIWIKGGFK